MALLLGVVPVEGREMRIARALIAAATLAVCCGAAGAQAGAGPWIPAGSIATNDSVTFAGAGIATASDGTGELAYDVYPALSTPDYATVSAPHGLSRVRLDPALQLSATALAALPRGGIVLGGIATGARAFALALVRPGKPTPAIVLPGLRQGLQAQVAVIAANPTGTVAVLGASGAQPVLSVCEPGLRCGPTAALAPSHGVLSTNGAMAAGSGLAVAIGADGRVIAAWVRNGHVEARWRTPNGRLGPLQQLAAVSSQVWLSVAISATGRAVLAWETQGDNDVVRPGPADSAATAAVATASAGGRFSRPSTLGSFPASPATSGAADVTLSAPPVIEVAFDGARPLVAWTAHDGRGFIIRAAGADAAATTSQTLSDPAQSATLGALVGTSNSGAIAVWSSCRFTGTSCSPSEVQASRASAQGHFASAQSIPGTQTSFTFFARPAVAAIDPTSGTAWVATTIFQNVRLWRQSPP